MIDQPIVQIGMMIGAIIASFVMVTFGNKRQETQNQTLTQEFEFQRNVWNQDRHRIETANNALSEQVSRLAQDRMRDQGEIIKLKRCSDEQDATIKTLTEQVAELLPYVGYYTALKQDYTALQEVSTRQEVEIAALRGTLEDQGKQLSEIKRAYETSQGNLERVTKERDDYKDRTALLEVQVMTYRDALDRVGTERTERATETTGDQAAEAAQETTE